MQNQPCQNPSCKSFGKSHPNCRCYGGMAEGGEVKHFCEMKKAHDENCEYFAQGGNTSQDLSGQDFDSLKADMPSMSQQQPEDLTGQDFDKLQEDLHEDKDLSGEDFDSLKDDSLSSRETPSEKILTGLEGAAQGFAGPLATAAELGLSKLGIPNISAEDIAARQQANPWIHGIAEAGGLGAGLASGVGEAGLIAKGVGKILPEALPALGKLGSTALKAFISNAAITGGDQISQAMIGQGDPEHPVSSALVNAGIGGLLGGIFEGGMGAAKQLNLGSKATSFLAGMGAQAKGLEGEEAARAVNLFDRGLYDEKMFNLGKHLYDNALTTSAWGMAATGANALSKQVGELGYWATPFLASAIKKPMSQLGKYTVPTVTKWLSEGAAGDLAPLLNYSKQISTGENLLNSSVNGLFKEGYKQSIPYLDQTPITQEAMDKVDEWIKNGGIQQDIDNEMENQNLPPLQPGLAEGGMVDFNPKENKSKPGIFHDHPLANLYPEQNMLLASAKGRISNYLSNLRPQDNSPKLAFDPKPDQTQQKRSYERALKIAIDPLHVMGKAAKGMLEPEDILHFNGLYPEINNVLQQKLTNRITEAQLKGEKPSYKMRQSLSLLTGSPLSSELKPQNILAAQATFSQTPSPQTQGAPQASKNKRGTSTLTKSSQAFLTGPQATATRQQKVS